MLSVVSKACCMWCSHRSAAWWVTRNGRCRPIRAGCPAREIKHRGLNKIPSSKWSTKWWGQQTNSLQMRTKIILVLVLAGCQTWSSQTNITDKYMVKEWVTKEYILYYCSSSKYCWQIYGKRIEVLRNTYYTPVTGVCCCLNERSILRTQKVHPKKHQHKALVSHNKVRILKDADQNSSHFIL
jgi:hypothetical protein